MRPTVCDARGRLRGGQARHRDGRRIERPGREHVAPLTEGLATEESRRGPGHLLRDRRFARLARYGRASRPRSSEASAHKVLRGYQAMLREWEDETAAELEKCAAKSDVSSVRVLGEFRARVLPT
jgi:hypothetical protein